MAREKRKRTWIFVMYPDSRPDDWKDILIETGLEGVISPLHDSDYDLEDGKKVLKKAHYHVLVKYRGPTSYSVVKGLTDRLNATVPLACESVKGQYRYFTHKDNPEKAQYKEKDMWSFGGFDISSYVDLTRGQVLEMKKDLQKLIRVKAISEYASLMNYLLDNIEEDGMSVLYEVASNHTYFLNNYITSQRHMQKDMQEIRINHLRKKITSYEYVMMELDPEKDIDEIKDVRKEIKKLKDKIFDVKCSPVEKGL